MSEGCALGGAPMKGVYLLHFEPRYRHAGHYLGYAKDVARRVEEHRAGRAGVRLTDAAARAGTAMMLVRIWVNGDRNFERKLKGASQGASPERLFASRGSRRTGSLARICPACAALKDVTDWTEAML